MILGQASPVAHLPKTYNYKSIVLIFKSHLNNNIKPCKKLLKLLWRLIDSSGLIAMFPNTCNRQRHEAVPLAHSMKPSYLHSYDRIYKKQHGYEKTDVRKSFEALHEGPEQYPNRVALPEQLDESGRAK